jgi:hypothetical protein
MHHMRRRIHMYVEGRLERIPSDTLTILLYGGGYMSVQYIHMRRRIPRDTLTILPGGGCDLTDAKSLVEHRHHLMAAVVERRLVVHHRERFTRGSVGAKRERNCNVI